jgi:DNA-binding transcriptional ArsR family regulator
MSMQRCTPATTVFDRDVDAEATLFKALADPARVAIVATLARAREPVCVCDFTAALGLNQSTVSHHLKTLKDAGLIVSERRGTWGFYALAPEARARVRAALDTVVPMPATARA